MGFRPDELAGAAHADLVHPDDRDLTGGDGPAPRAEVRVRHADGGWHWHEVIARDLTGNPAVGAVVVNHRDVSERRAIQERLHYEATHDALTGLINRAELLRTLDRELAAAVDSSPTVAVLYLDLDGFKQVNDSHGHETGDALLVAVASALRRSLLGADTAGRLGGDEFAVVVTGVERPEDAEAVAGRILSELDRPVDAAGVTLRARASIGVAVAEAGERRTDALMHRADTAMYHAKRAGTNGWQRYVHGMHDPSLAGQALEDDLRHAVDRGELRLHYQPVVDLASAGDERGAVTAVEALVRWQHPERGLLLPEMFLPLAEHSGLIHTLGRWVLGTAALQVRQWQAELHPGLRLQVNVSRRQFGSAQVVTDILSTLDHTGLAPADLELEIAETAVVDAEAVVARMAALREYGVRFALDDFGAGASSLRHLTRLPVDTLKLDPCFVAALDGTPNGSAVAEAVIRLGHALHLRTVAEGVETEAQAAELTLLGCDSAQGHHFARPLPPGEVEDLLRGVRPPAAPGPAAASATNRPG